MKGIGHLFTFEKSFKFKIVQKKMRIFFLHNPESEFVFKNASFELFSDVWYVFFDRFVHF